MVMEPDMDLLNETTWIQAGVDGRFGEVRATEYGLREFGYVDPDGTLHRVGSSESSRSERPNRRDTPTR